MTRQEQMYSDYSDYYKSVYGIRPRWSYDWTVAQFEEAFEELAVYAKIQAEEDRKIEEQKIADFKQVVQRTIALGAGDYETAIRWMVQDEEFICSQCVEYWVWDMGFLFTDFGRQLVKDIIELVGFKSTQEVA